MANRADRRNATWTLTPEALNDIGESFTSQAAATSELGTNSAIWAKVRAGGYVKRDVARKICERYLKFLLNIEQGHDLLDGSKHYEMHVRAMIDKYLIRGWKPDLYLGMIREIPPSA